MFLFLFLFRRLELGKALVLGKGKRSGFPVEGWAKFGLIAFKAILLGFPLCVFVVALPDPKKGDPRTDRGAFVSSLSFPGSTWFGVSSQKAGGCHSVSHVHWDQRHV